MRSRLGKIEDFLIPGAVIIAGYLILENLGLFGGSQDNASNNAAIDTSTSAGNAQALQTVNAQGINQTLNSSQLASLANDIYNQAGNFSGGQVSSGSQDQIVSDMEQIKNIADLYALKSTFGTKQYANSYFSTCNLLGFDCTSMDLDTTLNGSLDAIHLQTINSYLSSVGINYVF